MGISIFSGLKAGGGVEELEGLITMIKSISLSNSFNFGIAFGIGLFFSSMSMISSCAISRMGKSAGFIKYIPVSASTQVLVKTFWGNAIGIIYSLLISLLVLLIGIASPLEALLLLIAFSSSPIK